MSDPAAEARSLSNGDINEELSAAILGFDPSEKYPEWSNSSMREAYRAGYEDGLRQAIAERDAANAEVERLRAKVRQMQRQMELFLEDDDRNRLIVALAVSDE